MDSPTSGSGSEAGSGLPLEQRVAHLEQELAALKAYLQGLRTPQVQPAAPRPVSAVGAASVPPRVGAPVAAPAFKLPASENKESLENQFGSKVLSKVAIVLLLVGAAWFLKWTFDNHWIGPVGRILVGLAAGAALVVWSERFRKQKMVAFSYALKAVGTGVLYLSLWASFHVYHLVPAGVAFVAMVCVTLWNAFMAWSQDAEGLAGYALIGAYLTPVLVSTGEDHEIFLFSYLAIIAASCLVLIRVRPWHKLLLGALPLTAFFYIYWYSTYFTPDKAWLTAFFALLLWALFAVAPLLAADVENPALIVFVPVATAVFGALTIYSVLKDSGNGSWSSLAAWAAVGFAAAYMLLARLRQAAVSAVHLGLAIVFLTVAIPLKATGHGITLGWLVEGVVLVAIASREGLEKRARGALRLLGWGALLLGVAGTLVEPWMLGDQHTAFLNQEFATSLAAVIALGLATWFETRVKSADGKAAGDNAMAAIALVLINLVMLLAVRREIFRALNAGQESADFLFSAWMMLQGSAMMVLGFLKRLALARWLGLILLAATVIKVVVWDMRSMGTGYHIVSYLALGAILMAVSYAYQKDLLGLRSGSVGGNS